MGTVQLDFVGIGAAKAGTTWLAACLAEHPELCVSEPKELDYFCEKAIWPGYGINHDRDERWLAARFAHAKPGQKWGEYSNNYLCDASVPARIRAHNPACRILFCMRNPVDALYSFYHQIRKEQAAPETFEAFIETYPDVVDMGLYHHHLQPTLETFPREQICLLSFDEIREDADAVLARVFSFLEVDAGFHPPSRDRRVNESGETRSRWLRNGMAAGRKFLQHHPLGRRLRGGLWTLRVHRLAEWVQARNLRPAQRAPMAEATRQRLQDHYRADILQLAELSGRDLSPWLNDSRTTP